MEKRIFGIILTVLGIVGLIWGGIAFLQSGNGMYSVKLVIFSAVLGLLFFFAGIGLIRSTKDKPT